MTIANQASHRWKIIVGTLVIGMLAMAFAILHMAKTMAGVGAEGLFKIGSCLRDDEFGVLYKVEHTLKNRTYGKILMSEKYPSDEAYAVGTVKLWLSTENPRKLYVVQCPEGAPTNY